MRCLAALLTTLALLPAAHALKCKSVTRLMTPFESVDQRAFVVAAGTYGRQIDVLEKAKPHFLDADGTPVAAQLTRIGSQLIIRPTRGLKGTAKLIAPGWPTGDWSVVERDAVPPKWTGKPAVIEAEEGSMGRYGMRWRRIISAPVVNAGLLQLTFKGTDIVRYANVREGKLSLYGGPCGNTLGSVPPGTYTVELRPVGAAGALGPVATVSLEIPSRRR